MFLFCFAIVFASVAAQCENRTVVVSTASELVAAIQRASPGDVITLGQSVRYGGSFSIKSSGRSDCRIEVRGPHVAEKYLPVIDGGGYGTDAAGITITGDFVTVADLTVTNVRRGIVVDGARDAQITGVGVSYVGEEGVVVANGATGLRFSRSWVLFTGRSDPGHGYGIVIGAIGSSKDGCTDNAILDSRFLHDIPKQALVISHGSDRTLVQKTQFHTASMTKAASANTILSDDNRYILNSVVHWEGVPTSVVDGMIIEGSRNFIQGSMFGVFNENGYGVRVRSGDGNRVCMSNTVTRGKAVSNVAIDVWC